MFITQKIWGEGAALGGFSRLFREGDDEVWEKVSDGHLIRRRMGKGRWDGEVIFNIKPSILIFLKIKRTTSLPSLFLLKQVCLCMCMYTNFSLKIKPLGRNF